MVRLQLWPRERERCEMFAGPQPRLVSSNGLAMTASEAADAASQPVPKCKDGCLLLVAMSGAHESLSAGIGMRLPIVEWKSETSSL